MIVRVTPNERYGRYDQRNQHEEDATPMPPDPAAVERRLDAGEWLRPGEVAVLFDAGRATIDRWIKAGRIGYRRRGPAGYRVLKPEDVRRELDEYRRERRGVDDDTPGGLTRREPERD